MAMKGMPRPCRSGTFLRSPTTDARLANRWQGCHMQWSFGRQAARVAKAALAAAKSQLHS